MIKNTIDETAFLALIDRYPYLVNQVELIQKECLEKAQIEAHKIVVELLKEKLGILAPEYDLEKIASELFTPWEQF